MAAQGLGGNFLAFCIFVQVPNVPGRLSELSTKQNVDNFCTLGIRKRYKDVEVCCARTCGQCGDPGCGSQIGGASKCCVKPIIKNGLHCVSADEDGCIISDTTAHTNVNAPGTVFNLNGWKLQTCVTHKEISGHQLSSYSDNNFFLASDKGMGFRTPDNCPHFTPHSIHPRTELREIGVKDWKLGGTHELSAACKVMHVARAGTVIAQIHGSTRDERAMLMLLYWLHDGTVEAHVKHNEPPYHTKRLDLGRYKLGELMKYEVSMEGTKLAVTVNGAHVTYTPPVTDEETFYFKAGNYNQCNSNCDENDYAEVRFYEIRTKHFNNKVRG